MSTASNPRPWHSYLYGRSDFTEYPSRWSRLGQLGLVIFAATIICFERLKFSAVLGSIMAYFHMTKADFANLTTMASALHVVAALVVGPLMDRFGRKPVIVWTVFGWGIASIWMATTTTMTWFFVAWIVSTVVLGVANTGALALIRDYSPQMGRATAYGFFTIYSGVGPYVALWFVALLHSYLPTWQGIFYGGAGIAFVAGLVLLPSLRDLSPQVRHQVVVSAAQKTDVDERAREMTTEESMATMGRMVSILRSWRVWSLVMVIQLWAFTYMIISMYGPLFFQEAFGMSEAAAARNISWFWITWTIFVVVAGWLSDWLETRKAVNLFGCWAAAAVMMVIAVLPGRGVDTTTLLAIWLTLGVVAGFVYPPYVALYSENIEEISPFAMATAFALTNVIGTFGNIIKNFFALRIVEAWGWGALWASASGCAFLAPLFMIPATGVWLPRRWWKRSASTAAE